MRRPGITQGTRLWSRCGCCRGAPARRVRAPHTSCAPRLGMASCRYGCHSTQSKGDTVSRQRQLGVLIRAARCARRMTQAQLGRACGYSASAISRVEAGALRPTEQALLRIARRWTCRLTPLAWVDRLCWHRM
ncbi:helix-turn-helix domain-containing protein [Kitasatospora aureofaciens]|uniref:helix-turn-helix domain-containing protein n=1 Tax=Kitasatospora aureofaciens TaxID=1894 RepID=UPI0033E4BB72